jgi:tetratricopeptide (TPR) repeat protein
MPSRARIAAFVFVAFAAARLLGGRGARAAPAPDACDEAAAAAWKAVESRGGIVPEIEDDGTQAPPAWWRYPTPKRAAELFAWEARAPQGLYVRVAPGDLEPGDVVVRAAGVGACGRMAVLAGKLEERWMLQDERAADGATRTSDEDFFADGKALRPEAAAYRINVKSDSSLGHVRELGRDLGSLERTTAERPPLIAKDGRAFVDRRVHDLLDEAWSLKVDPPFDLEHSILGGRALALAAALDWPGAAESAAAVLDDAHLRAPDRAEVLVARASVHLLEGRTAAAVADAQKAVELPGAPARARYVLGRALLADGRAEAGLGELRRYLAAAPADPRAGRLVSSGVLAPRLEPGPASEPALRWVATAEHAGVTSTPWGFHAEWPIPWRVVGDAVTPEDGVLIDFVTERVLDEGEPLRGAAVLVAQRPASPGARAALLKKGGRNMFPTATLKTLPPLLPGSRHEAFRERGEDHELHAGEVTTLEHAGVVYFLVLNAPARAAPKLKDEYAAFVKSLRFLAPAP